MQVRIAIASVVAAGALVLLATPSDAQTVSTAEASVNGSLDAKPGASAEDTAIRPFHARVAESTLMDLRQRIAATRWPDGETVSDQSQGVQLATLKELVHY